MLGRRRGGGVDYSRVAFADERERALLAEAQVGQEAIDFLNSRIGQYLHGCAKQQIAECTAALADVSPDTWFGRRKIKRLQNELAQARMFSRWLAEAIQAGQLAEKELLGEQQGE